MQDDAGDDDLSAVVGGALGIASGQTPELFQAVEAAFDDVAFPVPTGIEGRRSPAGCALGLTAGDLVTAFRDGGLDLPRPQGFTGRWMRVGLVRQDPRNPHRAPVDLQIRNVVQQWQQPGIVAGLTRGEDEGQRQTERIDSKVDLAGQSAPGPPEAVPFDGEGLDPVCAAPFFRAPAACW